jgi:hypothetical protein
MILPPGQGKGAACPAASFHAGRGFAFAPR